MKLDSSQFENQQVRLDGNEYNNCVFNSCTILYSGMGTVHLYECDFNNCKWQFDGPAANTINFLAGVYRMGGDFVRLVDTLIKSPHKANRA